MAKLNLKMPKLKFKKPTKKLFKSTKFLVSVFLVLGLGGFGYSGYYYYQNYFTDTDRIFYSMLDNSLSTNSVMRVAEQEGNNRKESQSVQIVFSPEVKLHTQTDLEQITQSRERSVVGTETYATKDTDFVRYTNIQIPQSSEQKVDYSKVINVWAKRDGVDESGASQAEFLNEATFTFIPFGNFPNDIRAKMVNDIRAKKVYIIKSDKIQFENGRPVLSLTASINPRKFVEIMQDYAKKTGLGNLEQLDPNQYPDVNNFGINIKIDVISRHLTHIVYPDSERIERYFAYGAKRPVELPSQAISLQELQSRIQEN